MTERGWLEPAAPGSPDLLFGPLPPVEGPSPVLAVFDQVVRLYRRDRDATQVLPIIRAAGDMA